MLAFDALCTDLIFAAGDGPDPEVLMNALGGEEAAQSLKILDPDMQDPRFEMELSPSRPFRRRGERRLLIVDDAGGPLREDPRTQPVVEVDLRPAKEHLIAMCEALGDTVRLGRLFSLGSWGEAVLVARSAVDLRAWALQSWVLDPTVDTTGKRRATPLSQAEFEEKILAYERRLEELPEAEILARLGPASLERRGDWLVVSVLDAMGHWDVRDSLALEQALAAVDRFSMIPGAPQGEGMDTPPSPPAEAAPEPEAPARAAPAVPLTLLEGGERPIFLFPAERFDLEVAAALGKGDWYSILSPGDADGPTRDRTFRNGAGFVAPLEFLSEVFIDGKPLSRPQFDENAETLDSGARVLRVHFPRFGPALLLVLPTGQRFITSEIDRGPGLTSLLAKRAA